MSKSRGFTLVEMLVATALVVLMMLMFAQVFKTASGLVSNQKGMAEHDQNVRTMTILLRGDVGQRTFRDVVPFEPVADAMATVPNDSFKQGFFAISENFPDDTTDDVLHMTIKIDEGEIHEGSPQLPFAGKATLIRYADPAAMAPGNVVPVDADIDEEAERQAFLLANRNQPEFDDGQLSVNGTGTSRFAEVSWFLRNGTLYRRMMLIRDPYDAGGFGPQPTNFDGTQNLIPGDYTALNVPPIPDADGVDWHKAVGRFWYDFDYSAFNDPQNNTPAGKGLTFHSAPISLANESPSTNLLGSFTDLPISLGIPMLRYGNSIRRGLDMSTVAPPPREYLVGTNLSDYDRSTFIGRFTIQESSHSAFTYPNSSPATGGPFQNGTTLTLGTDGDGLVDEFITTEINRRGEDIVMTNVHSFDIQVWDDGVRDFVNLGHSRTSGGLPVGDFHTSRNANTVYGNRYDTWHPNSQMPDPPYRPIELDGVTPKSLQAIKIQVRFYEQSSDSMRDMTFTFPLK
jgi:prepilin-type N-terminal cleavage/methylation domain-containing protein